MQGIKFNKDGITAILEGRKTMTRRPIKIFLNDDGSAYEGSLDGYEFEAIQGFDSLVAVFYNAEKEHALFAPIEFKIGDTVFYVDHDIDKHFTRCDFDDECDVCNNAEEGSYAVGYCSYDGEVDSYICGKCAKKAIDNMGEEFARIFLKITNIKVERLHDISEEDCIKEGVWCDECRNGAVRFWLGEPHEYDSVQACCQKCNRYTEGGKHGKTLFHYEVWNKLPYQPPCDWNSNPYVFVYDFEVVK